MSSKIISMEASLNTQFCKKLTETLNAQAATIQIIKRRTNNVSNPPIVKPHFMNKGAQGNVHGFTVMDDDGTAKDVSRMTELEKQFTKLVVKTRREWFPDANDPDKADEELTQRQQRNHANEIVLTRELAQKPQHPNMITLHDVGDEHIEMEKGGSPVWKAQEDMQKDKSLSQKDRTAISCRLALGATKMLLALIEDNVQPNDAHRDNCIIGLNDGELKFIDGGLRQKMEEPYFLLQNPHMYDKEVKEDYKDYHPIDTIIRILEDSGEAHKFHDILVSLQQIGQDKYQKERFKENGKKSDWDYSGQTLEDVIASQASPQEKQRAFDKIKETLLGVSKILEQHACDPEEVKKYFNRPK